MKKFLSFITRPYGIYLVTTILSILAWALPLKGGLFVKGYDHQKSIFDADIFYVLLWSVGIYSVSYVGYNFGIKYSRFFNYSTKINSKEKVFGNRIPYYLLSAVGAFGTFYTIYSVVGTAGLRLIIFSFLTGNGNILNDTLYADYHIGFYSLRYFAVLSGALGLYKIALRKMSWLDFFNLFVLLLDVSISTRLAMIICTIIFLSYLVRGGLVRFRTDFMIGGVLVLLTLLTAANYFRNSRYYESFGIDNPIIMNVAQVDAYLGTPFQGELTTAEDPIMRAGLNLSFDTQVGYTNIAPNFNTNSAMTSILNEFGLIGYPIVFLTCLTSSLVMGMLRRHSNSYAFLIYGTLLYCYSDMFRLFMFNTGQIITLVLAGLLASFWKVNLRTRFTI